MHDVKWVDFSPEALAEQIPHLLLMYLAFLMSSETCVVYMLLPCISIWSVVVKANFVQASLPN